MAQFLKQNILLHANIHNKIKRETVCKLQFLKAACNSIFEMAQ